jgi:formamidopyrimidine-DNA glycosylase
MPELPEVETTRRGILPHVLGRSIRGVIVRRADLRQPVPSDISRIEGLELHAVRRRSKYLLLDTTDGPSLLIHLGMSGSLRITHPSDPWRTHDHVALDLEGGRQLRFHDPRRFGLVLLVDPNREADHPLLARLGPEPLEEGFDGAVLAKACAGRQCAIKLRIMDASAVVGVGNIYASEALFRAGIPPQMPAGRVSRKRLDKLANAIRSVLADAIEQGGTTLRDFLNADGQPGYFRQRLYVYERKDHPCRLCQTPIRHTILGQRSTYWCPRCQRSGKRT